MSSPSFPTSPCVPTLETNVTHLVINSATLHCLNQRPVLLRTAFPPTNSFSNIYRTALPRQRPRAQPLPPHKTVRTLHAHAPRIAVGKGLSPERRSQSNPQYLMGRTTGPQVKCRAVTLSKPQPSGIIKRFQRLALIPCANLNSLRNVIFSAGDSNSRNTVHSLPEHSTLLQAGMQGAQR